MKVVEASALDAAALATVAESADEGWALIRDEVDDLAGTLRPPQVESIRAQEAFEGCDPETRLEALHAYVEMRRRQAGGPLDDETLADHLGDLAALTLAELLAWTVREVRSPETPRGGVAVVAPDGSLAMYPSLALYDLLLDPDRVDALPQLVRTIRAGRAPAAAPDAYVTLLP